MAENKVARVFMAHGVYIYLLCCGADDEMNIIKITKNPVALFFNMLRAFISGCRMNQESLIADDSFSVIGALLQKVSIQPYLFLCHFQ